MGIKNHKKSFKKILQVESLIKKDTPHIITKEAYSMIQNSFFMCQLTLIKNLVSGKITNFITINM